MYMHKKDEFNNIILSLDKRTINNNPNWVSSSERGIEILTEIIEQEENNGHISKGQLVLDLGSGNGSAAFIWAYNGYKSIGIEIDPELYGTSIRAKDEYEVLKDLDVTFYYGSYYPEDYVKSKKTATLEKKILKNYSKKQKNITFNDTTYKDNNINIKEIDIFYAYIWPFQMPSVYELFYNYARSDSKLIAIGPLREAVLSHYPELKIMGNSIYK